MQEFHQKKQSSKLNSGSTCPKRQLVPSPIKLSALPPISSNSPLPRKRKRLGKEIKFHDFVPTFLTKTKAPTSLPKAKTKNTHQFFPLILLPIHHKKSKQMMLVIICPKEQQSARLPKLRIYAPHLAPFT